MSAPDDALDPAQEGDVAWGLKNLVLAGLWLAPIGILGGIGIAVLIGLPIIVVRTALSVDPAGVGSALAGANLTTVTVLLAGGLLALYRIASRETFGEKDTEEAIEATQDAASDTLPDGGQNK